MFAFLCLEKVLAARCAGTIYFPTDSGDYASLTLKYLSAYLMVYTSELWIIIPIVFYLIGTFYLLSILSSGLEHCASGVYVI